MAEGMIFVYLFGFVIAVLWILLPFAVFGIKERLDDIIAESARFNELLEKVVSERELASSEKALS